MAGRPWNKQPLETHLARGTYRAHRHGPIPIAVGRPAPDAIAPARPATLSAGGRAVWDRLAPVVVALGTLTTSDTEAFAALCELQSSLDLVYRAKGDPAFVPFAVSPDGEAVTVHPVLRLELQITAGIRPYYEKFCLDPTSRARLQPAPGTAPPPSKWARLQAP